MRVLPFASSLQFRALPGVLVLAAAVLLLAEPSAADGLRGSALDRLDWSGSATDRYLDGNEVVAVLHGAAAAFAACASGDLASPLPAEPVWLDFGVDPEGRAASAEVRQSAQPGGLNLCLLSALLELDFGDHDGMPGRYSYPVVLKRQGEGVRNLPYPVVLVVEEELLLPLLSLPLDLSAEDRAAIVKALAPKAP